MTNYISLGSVVGTMLLSGCAGAMPASATPATPVGTASLTSAELATSELAPSPYTREAVPSWWAEDPWGTPPASPPAPIARTWGSMGAIDYGF